MISLTVLAIDNSEIIYAVDLGTFHFHVKSGIFEFILFVISCSAYREVHAGVELKVLFSTDFHIFFCITADSRTDDY